MAAATKNKRGRPADSLYADAVRRNISNRAYNPEISAKAVQNAVRDVIQATTGFGDAEVNVHVSGISFDR